FLSHDPIWAAWSWGIRPRRPRRSARFRERAPNGGSHVIDRQGEEGGADDRAHLILVERALIRDARRHAIRDLLAPADERGLPEFRCLHRPPPSLVAPVYASGLHPEERGALADVARSEER